MDIRKAEEERKEIYPVYRRWDVFGHILNCTAAAAAAAATAAAAAAADVCVIEVQALQKSLRYHYS